MCGVFLLATKRRNRAWTNILNNHTEDRFQKMRRRAFAYYGGNKSDNFIKVFKSRTSNRLHARYFFS